MSCQLRPFLREGGMSVKAFEIPAIDQLSTTYFLRLALNGETGEEVGSNFYRLSTELDVLDWKHSTWYYTPAISLGDFTSLPCFPAVEVRLNTNLEHRTNDRIVHVNIQNPSRKIASFVHVKVVEPLRDAGDEGFPAVPEVPPVVWQDNYVSLLTGEKKELTAALSGREKRPQPIIVQAEGWNVPARSVPVTMYPKQ